MATKKQHYVPRSYLRHFAFNFEEKLNDRQLKVNIYDKKAKKSFVNSIYNIASKNYFYDIEGLDNQFLENFFADYIEPQFSNLNRKIDDICSNPKKLFNKNIISLRDKSELSLLLVIQILRTKRTRAYLKKMYTHLDKKIQEFINLYKSILNDDNKNMDFNTEINEKKIQFEYLTDKDYILELVEFIFNSVWVFCFNLTNTPFITSDNPVSRLPRLRQKNTLILDNKNQNEKQNLEIAGFMSDHLQINYPISPKVSLKIFRKEVPNYKEFKNYNNCLVPIPRKDVILQDNIMQFLMSYRQVFIPQKPENSNEIIKKIKEIDIENFNGPII